MSPTGTLPQVVELSQDELASGKFSEQNLEKAVQIVRDDGLVVISNAIPVADLDHLNKKMVEDAQILQGRGENMPYNHNKGNIQQDPPPIKEYFHKSIFLNPFAAQISTAVLGPKPKWAVCSANTALPPVEGEEPQRQPVHSDADFAHPPRPFALVVNVPLITFTPENGSTEIWLGTHTGELTGLGVQESALRGQRLGGRIQKPLVEERRAVSPPSQPIIPKGSIVVRDLRLWHAGVPNWSNEIRVMLAMIHFAPWFPIPLRLELSEGIKPLVDEQELLEVPVDWISEEKAKETYLKRGFGMSNEVTRKEE